MPDQVNPGKAEEQVSSESGLLLSVEPLGGGRLSASAGDDRSDASDVTGADTDGSDTNGDALGGDTDTTDADGGDSDASDTDTLGGGDADATDADESDADGTDMGDSEESESGLPGENPLGLTRERTGKGDDSDSRDS